MKNAGILIGGAMLIASLSGAVAQRAAQGQPPPIDSPQRTTATYGDWVVQCVTEAQQGIHPVKALLAATFLPVGAGSGFRRLRFGIL